MDLITVLISYLCAINLVTFMFYWADKIFAKRKQWRISEFNLIFLALIGGSIGAILAMQIFRHKTLHLKFKFGVPLILILQVAGTLYFVN